ncbi:hypothetical protein [Herbiconiux liangxiaofengii]|uniref:hypothetical protein n=1 Tax=Herbiconiux liangxiaofengii TaxID=3342795 RepID=UPI0035B9DFD4
MSTLRHPVGPQPKKVYWRRRLVVLLIVAAIVAVVVLIIVRPGSGSDSAAGPADGSTGIVPSASSDAAAPDAGAASAAPGTVDAGSGAAADAAACAGGNIQVTPVTDADTYPAGASPQLSFTITNTGSEACTLNAGTSQQVYTITSGDEVYWKSTDCQTDPSDTQALLEPGVAVSSTPFTWDRTRSAADTCDSTARPAVPAGGASYHLDVSVAGITSADSKQFVLN